MGACVIVSRPAFFNAASTTGSPSGSLPSSNRQNADSGTSAGQIARLLDDRDRRVERRRCLKDPHLAGGVGDWSAVRLHDLR